MLSKALFKQAVGSNYKILLLFTAVLALYLAMVCAVFTPQTLEDMGGLADSLGAMGNMLGDMNSVTGFIGQMYYGLIAVLFPMIYCIVTGNRLIAAKVDSGSMACLLSTPTKRSRITVTYALYFVLSLMVMFGFLAVFGVLMCAAFQPGTLDVEAFLLFDLGAFLLAFATSGICYAASCIFNFSRTSFAVGAGLPLAFFLFQMMSELSEDLDFVKYLSLNTLFSPDDILRGDGYVPPFVCLGVVGLALYGAGIAVFRRKDLPL